MDLYLAARGDVFCPDGGGGGKEQKVDFIIRQTDMRQFQNHFNGRKISWKKHRA